MVNMHTAESNLFCKFAYIVHAYSGLVKGYCISLLSTIHESLTAVHNIVHIAGFALTRLPPPTVMHM